MSASGEGTGDGRSDKTIDGDAVSRTGLDREAVIFCMVRRIVSASFLLRGGRVVDPESSLDARADVRVRDGVIAAVGTLEPEAAERRIDVDGLVVTPGLIDVHVHLREPGQEWKETIETGTGAAAAGGFTTVFCMPNTEPALDSVAAIEELNRRVDHDALVTVRPIASITEGRQGRGVVDYEALAAAGAVGFSDDGDTTADAGIMRQALEASRGIGLPVMVHCEDRSLAHGAMHEGEVSRKLGQPAIPAEAEETIIGRDLALANLTGGWLHVCHVSTGRGARLVEAAKADGVRVTAEVMPHHLSMTDDWVAGCRELINANEVAGLDGIPADPNTKVNPPLRTREDARDLLAALKSRTIDLVATDHAPHSELEKRGKPLSAAAFGFTASEAALPLMLALVRAGNISLRDLVHFLSLAPARLWSLGGGALKPGAPADITVFDPDEQWTVTPDRLVSRSANTPLLGMELRGRVKLTFVGGDERHRDW